MKTTRIITVFTANVGRKATIGEFKDNIQRIKNKIGTRNVFGGWQEVDEDDKAHEMKYIRKVFKETHRFVGTNTHVPIMIPRSFEVDKPIIREGSQGVAHLQPDRHVVKAVVRVGGLKADRRFAMLNTHFGRDIPELREERAEDDRLLRSMIGDDLASIVTLDANTRNYPFLDMHEKKLATSRIDYIRGIERDETQIRLIDRGTVRLTGDGHNCEWANLQITWP